MKNNKADSMNHLTKLFPQIKLEPEETGYEFGYYTFDSFPDIETTKKQAKNNKKHKVNVIDETVPTQDVVFLLH